MTTTRRLAAILAADVAGYSRLMGADEVGTLEALKAHRREVIDPAIAANRGRIVKTTGDGMLVEFASAVDAVTCAMGIQERMAERNAAGAEPRIELRIGINIGDIISEDDDIFGDDVNVAARVENECAPGGVCLSDDAHRQVRGKTTFVFEDLGERSLKNIDRPVRLYAVRSGSTATAAPPFAAASTALPLPDKPSIAVLPFQNMSGDPEQEYFADGMVEDIITALSRFKSLFVIARNSSFTYKGRAVDIKQVGRELGVRYVLEGSVRKAGGRVRITGQLIEAATNLHLWADKFEGALDDIFDLQDRFTSSVVGLVAPKIEGAEIARAQQKTTSNLEAYDYYLRGIAGHDQWTREGNEEALRMFSRAVELDPNFAAAIARICSCYTQRRIQNWAANPAQETADAIHFARRALDVGRDDPTVLTWSGFTLAFLTGDFAAGLPLLDRAVQLNPNLAIAWMLSGVFQNFLGHPEQAIEYLLKARQLNPVDTLDFSATLSLGFAHFLAGRIDEALVWLEKSLAENPRYLPVLRFGAAIYASAGQIEKASQLAKRLLELNPNETMSRVRPLVRRPDDWRKIQEALRLAGVPE